MQWYKILLPIVLLPSLAGCGFGIFSKREKPIQVVTTPVERTPLNLENPPPLRLRPIEWIVITPENWEEVFRQMQSKDQNLVLFGLTSDGYQNLALTIAEIRNLINTQKIIIGKYRDYYESRPAGNKD